MNKQELQEWWTMAMHANDFWYQWKNKQESSLKQEDKYNPKVPLINDA